ncbi:MAG: valine--tRNA ligase [Clostridia bacterium]|nr:valine--tRNA ligase [Clostridia bacterium]
MKMDKTYQPNAFETQIYEFWENNKYFHAEPDENKTPFTVVIPPPNITGQLHMGHALNNTLQDILVRFKRMQGYCTLWLPGTDHASIATEVKIVNAMREEGLSKEEVGREGFLERAWAWKDKYGGRIVKQLRRLGSSCDWDREAFTMDESLNKAVRKVFVNLYNKGLIYRGNRIVNWCTCCKTAISDAEVEYEEQKSFLWHIAYPFKDGSGSVVVATTRPETMLGDTAVAVNPKDPRYSAQVGKTLILPIVNREIPLLPDDYVESDFGTGAVKITPAHDPNDYEVGLRHDLEQIRIFNDDGTVVEGYGKYSGKDRFEVRKMLEEDLKEQGFLVKKEEYTHNVGVCYRCHTTIETILGRNQQWFVKMEPLAKPAIEAVKKKETNFVPNRYSAIYYHWMNNIKDWCISRQLWWGHRIPAYYCADCGEVIVAEEKPCSCPKCNGKNLTQDEDVLDTWFSSALWPFSTLGWPEKTKDLDYFYPTSVLITAYDIIFFWVARMIFSGIEHMGKAPFKDVLIHGLVRDAQGRKMSKSLGNGIDPLEIIDNYGADSLRFALANGIAPGGDTRFSQSKVESNRNFINKVWNASRFVLMNVEGFELGDIETCKKTFADKWILNRLNKVTREVTRNLEKYEIGIAGGKLYDFVWGEFCDWYIELVKPVLYGSDEQAKKDTLTVLVYVLGETLKLLHPYIPFVTEKIYQDLPNHAETIMLEKWPTAKKKFAYYKEAREFEGIMEVVKSLRNVRAEVGLIPSKKIDIFFVTDQAKLITKCSDYIKKLAGVQNIVFTDEAPEKSQTIITSIGSVYVPMGELIDVEKELARLNGEREKLLKEIQRSEGMLSNEGFVARAPAALVEKEREKLALNSDKLAKIDERVASLKE